MIPDEELDFCLLIPCYNNFTGLVESIRSVNYTANRFMIVVVNDGSKEIITEEKIHSKTGTKYLLFVLQNENNLGITAALNNGLKWIEKTLNVKYIARLDCGDICSKERFTLQVQYMDADPDIGLTGSWCRIIDERTGFKFSYKTPVKSEAIERAMYFRNVFMHATVMFRASLLKEVGYYPSGYEYAEDYAFFWKLIKCKPSFIFNRYLVTCQLNKSGISFKNRAKQIIARWKVVKKLAPANPLLKIVAFLKLLLLFIVPKGITLLYKKWRG